MIFRQIGDTGINCSVIGLGTGRLASVSGGISNSAVAGLVAAAQDCGVNLIDTADSYGQGESEKRLGRALQGRRDKFILTTKAGYTFSNVAGLLKFAKPLVKKILGKLKGGRNLARSVRTSVSRQDFSPDAIQRAVESSLVRLQTDYLDVFMLHSPPRDVMGSQELFERLRALQKQGKFKCFGISSLEPEVLECALTIPGIAIVQTPVNPLPASNQIYLPKLQARKIAVVANRIFLSGDLVSATAASGQPDPEVAAKKALLTERARQSGISLNQLLIKYSLGRPGIVSVLTGTTNPKHLQQNVADALANTPINLDDSGAVAGSKSGQ